MGSGRAPRANHARHLVVISVAGFALPLLQRAAYEFGAPRTPPRVAALLLVACLLASILNARPGRAEEDPAPASTRVPEPPALDSPPAGGPRAGV